MKSQEQTNSSVPQKIDIQYMAYRAFCEHGKVRALLVDPAIGEHSPQYVQDAYKELAKWARKGLKSDHVIIEEARQSDMRCDVCDAPRLRRAKALNRNTERSMF